VIVTLNSLTRQLVNGSQSTFVSDDLRAEVSSPFSSVAAHYQEEQKKPRGYKIHTNKEAFPSHSQSFIDHILAQVVVPHDDITTSVCKKYTLFM
jgi:hypothetical protein